MNLKDMFEKEFLFESKKEDKKSTKIFYKIDINLKKKEEEAPAPEQPPVDNTQQVPAPEQPVDLSVDQGVPANDTLTPPPSLPGEIPPEDQLTPPPPLPNASVVTEDDDKDEVEINDEESIVRKIEGEIVVEKEDIDNIQSIDDILSKLTESEKDGVKILDEFSADMLTALINPATQQEVNQKVDKESKIFAEIIYGKKEDNSVGLRIIKRKNSEMVTMSMMLDNKIVNAPYNKDIIDKRIAEYRNNELEEVHQ